MTEVKKIGTAIYQVKAEDLGRSGEGLLMLGQGYDKGWIGFQIIDKRLKILEHTKVNSWANGWLAPSAIDNQNSTIYIVFWPQFLEWGGIILALLAFLAVIFL